MQSFQISQQIPDHVEETVRRKIVKRQTSDDVIEVDNEFGIEDRKSIVNTDFESGDTPNAKLQFRSFQYGEFLTNCVNESTASSCQVWHQNENTRSDIEDPIMKTMNKLSEITWFYHSF